MSDAGPVLHHEVEVAAADRTQIGGIPCTTLERTGYDIIRTTQRETAMAAADAALRLAAWRHPAPTRGKPRNDGDAVS